MWNIFFLLFSLIIIKLKLVLFNFIHESLSDLFHVLLIKYIFFISLRLIVGRRLLLYVQRERSKLKLACFWDFKGFAIVFYHIGACLWLLKLFAKWKLGVWSLLYFLLLLFPCRTWSFAVLKSIKVIITLPHLKEMLSLHPIINSFYNVLRRRRILKLFVRTCRWLDIFHCITLLHFRSGVTFTL